MDINNFALNISLTRYSLATYYIGKKIPNVSPVDGILGVKWLYAGMSAHTHVRARDNC